MIKNIETKFEVGDWVKPNWDRHSKGSTANYINITKRNIETFNGNLSNSINKDSYFLVGEDEIKFAEKYLQDLMSVKVGDYINVGTFKMPHGEIDKIIEIPQVENPLEVMSYRGSVKTERGNSAWYVKVPDLKVSNEEAIQYFKNQRTAHLNSVAIFEKQLEDLKVK